MNRRERIRNGINGRTGMIYGKGERNKDRERREEGRDGLERERGRISRVMNGREEMMNRGGSGLR